MSEINCRILYVDDFEDSSEMFRLLLSDSDYEVHTARTIDEAINWPGLTSSIFTCWISVCRTAQERNYAQSLTN